MNENFPPFYEFEGFRLDPGKRLLWRNGEAVALMPKAFDVLLVLVSNHGRVVGKDELMSGVWRDAVVEENSLNVNVSALRKAFDEKPNDHRFIVTVPGVGYKFVAAVRELESNWGLAGIATAPAPAPAVPILSGGAKKSGWKSVKSRLSLALEYVGHHRGVALSTFIVLVGGILGLLVITNRPPEAESLEKISVAVADFTNETGESDLNGLSGMLITSLEQSRRLSVLTRSRMFDILKQLGRSDAEHIDETLGREICERAKVNVLVIASVRKFDNLYTIDLKVLDPQKDQYVYTASEKSEGKASIPGMIDLLSEATRGILKERSGQIKAAAQRVADVTTPNLEAYRHYFLGEQLIAKFNIEGAEQEFNRATSLDPNFALAHYQLAYMRAWGNMDNAKEPVRRAMQSVEKTPEKERYMIRALNAHLETNFDAAEGLWREALERYPDYKEAHWAFGDFSLHRGNYETAALHLGKVLELDPTFVPALDHLCWLSRETEAHEKMLQYAKLWVDRVGSEDAYAWLCESYRVQRDFESAFATNRRILELFSNSPLFARCSGDSYLFMDQYGKAEAEYKKLINESRPQSHRQMGYRLLSLVYAYEGRYREAERMVDQEIEVAAKQGDNLAISNAYLEKAYLLAVGAGDGDAARRAISKQFEFRAADNFGYHVLFNTFLLLGEYQKAAPIVKSQLLAVGPFGDQVVNGYVHRARGEYDAAIKDFETVVARGFVTDKIVRGYELAECYLETGQIEKAIEVLRRTQKLFSQGPPFYRAAVYPRSFYLLGKIYEKKGDQKLAIASYEKFLSLWKNADKDLAELVAAKLRLAKLKVAA